MKLLNGLNTDVASVDQPAGTYRRSRNMILDDLAGALATEKAPLLYASQINDSGDLYNRFENQEVCGRFDVPGDRTIFGIKARNTTTNSFPLTEYTEQIIEVQEDGTINTLVQDGFGNLQFDSTNPFQGVGYVNGAGELILVWSNGIHKPLYLNADTHSNNQDEPLLVFPEANYPMARPTYNGSNDQTGSIYGGAYTFVLAYEVVDGTDNLTQYGPGVGSFQIGNGNTDENKKFRTSAKMKFYGLDTRYNYARVYAVRNWLGTETVTYADRISITGEDQEWAYTGQEIEPTNVIADELYIPTVSYKAAETIAVSDDRLFMANLEADVITFEEGQAIANNIDVFWTADEAGLSAASYDNIQLLGTAGTNRNITNYTSADFRDCYPNRGETENGHPDDTPGEVYTDHGGFLGGFMPNEVYALYVSFLMKDGQWSRAFHIPAGGDSGDFTSTARDGAASLSASTANIKTAGTFNQLLGGKTGYHENATDSYPNVGTFFDVGLNNDAVRHHIMPSPKQLWQSTQTAQGGDDSLNVTDYSGEWCGQQVSLFVDNVVIGNDTAEKIQGFRLFYAKATTDKRRVKAYAPAWRYTYDYTNNQQMRIYDPLLLSEKPAVDGWSVTEVYKKMSYLEQLSYVMASSDVEEFGYMPANTTNDTFDNEFRESALCLKLGEALTIANDWHAGYPGFFGGFNIQYLTNSSEAYHGWDCQIVHDSEAFDYPERTSGAGLIGDNFVSIFGTFLNNGSATNQFGFDSRPTKNDSTYPVVYGAGGHAGAQFNALTGASAGSGNLTGSAYMGFGGNGGSFVMLSRDYDDYFLNYEGQQLVDTHDLVRVDGGATYKSNQVVRGGDTFITPVVVEFLDHNQSNDPQAEAANASTDFRFIKKMSYFTWTRVRPGKNDLDGTLNWTDLVGYSDATSTPFNGETFNTYNLGAQWFKLNDGKSAFPSVSDSLDVSEYPNRIIRSAKQGYESTKFQWGEFLAADYYDNALAKESIRNVEDYQGELIIHHGNALYKTRSKFNFDASGANVFVGTGDIFQAPPQELFPDNAGYAGVTHWGDTLLCRAGYIWIDRAGKRIFKLGQGMEELSAKGIRNYIRDSFLELPTQGMVAASNTTPTIFSTGQGGYALGYDPYNERLLFTKRYCVNSDRDDLETDGETLSYSLRHQCWTSMHSYRPYQYFQTYNKLWAYNEANNGGVNTADGSGNLAGIFEISGTAPGTKYLSDGTENTAKDSCFVDAVFNMGGPVSKVWSNFNWRTRAGEGEGTSTKNETFEQARVYNDYQISNINTDFRMTDDRWQFNQFRDYSVAGTPGWFDADTTTFKGDGTILDNTKAWYNTPRFVSDYAIIRLETLNTTGNRLYLLDVSATARKAHR